MSASHDALKSLVRRIEATEDEIRALNQDKSDIYKEAKADGFDVKVLRKVVAARRLDASERQEADAIFEMYWAALHGSESLVRAHVETIEQFDPETGEIETGSTPEAGEGGLASAPVDRSVLAHHKGESEVVTPSADESVTSREVAATALPAPLSDRPLPPGRIRLPTGEVRMIGCLGGVKCGSPSATKQLCYRCTQALGTQHSEAVN